MNDSLQEIIRSIKEINPLIWETASKQAHIDAVFNVIFASSSLLFCIIFTVMFKHYYNAYQEKSLTDWSTAMIAVAILAPFNLISTVAFAVTAIRYYLNPDFYAVQSILSLIKR